MKRIYVGCLALIVVLVLACAGLLLMPSAARRALPWNATDIHEYYSDARFGSDYMRCLKARVTHEGFLEFARRLKLNDKHDPENHRHELVSWPGCAEPWWDPSPSLEGALFEYTTDKTYYAVAKYENGYVYFTAFSW